jgi:hypothetical protein
MKKRIPELLAFEKEGEEDNDDMQSRDQEIIDKIKRLGAVEFKDVLAKLEQSQRIGLLIHKKHQDEWHSIKILIEG